jgi:hypothetical protein
VIAYARKLDTMRLRATSNRERVDWIGVLSRAKRECLTARAAVGRDSHHSTHSQHSSLSHGRDSSGSAGFHGQRDSGYAPSVSVDGPYSPGMYSPYNRDSGYSASSARQAVVQPQGHGRRPSGGHSRGYNQPAVSRPPPPRQNSDGYF